MALATAVLDGGFNDAVHESQSVFRTLMDAMARPGTIHTLDTAANAPHPFSAAQSAVLLCLADPDTSVWLSPVLHSKEAEGWIRFHSGAPVAQSTGQASFAFLSAGEALPDFWGFKPGTQEYPDRSTTLIVELPSLTEGAPLTATGPGIDGEYRVAVDGLPGDFVKRWEANHALFPRGVDMVFTCGDKIICLPRSTKLKPVEA